MRSRYLPFICAGLALACTVLAGQPKNLVPQQMDQARLVQPSRAASYTLVNGRMVLTSDWVTLGTSTRADFSATWDSAEHDLTGGVLGAPTDQANPPGPLGCLDATIPNGNRWFFGAAYSNPFVSADILGAGPGDDARGVGHAWYIDVGDSEPDVDADGLPDSDLFIAIQQFEDMDVVGCTDDGSGFIDGVIYDFSGNAWDPAFYNYTNIDLTASGFGHTMPADGNGGYQIIYGIAYDPDTNTITIPTPIDPVTGLGVNIQPMLWGTGENEVPAPDDGRAGDEVDGQFDDDAPVDGSHDLALECYSYLFGLCPDPLAAHMGFYVKGSEGPRCGCFGADQDGNGVIDIADLAFFLSRFGSPGEGHADCPDINEDGIVDISDLALILSAFGTDCDPPDCPNPPPLRAEEPFFEIDPEVNEWCIYYVWKVKGAAVPIGRVYIKALPIPAGFCCPWTNSWFFWDWKLMNAACDTRLERGEFAYVGRWTAEDGPPPGPCWQRCP